MANVAYIRVSSTDQNEARQREALAKYQIDKWFTDECSGKSTQRPGLSAMLDWIRDGDTVYISDFSRLARNTKDLLDLVGRFQDNDIKLISDKESFDLSSPTGRLMLTMLGAIYEFERELIRERQREGIEIAKREGKYKGGKPKVIAESEFDRLYQMYQCREIKSKGELARRLQISRPTLDKFLRKREAEGSPMPQESTSEE